MITDLQYLALSDLSYEDFKQVNEGDPLKNILNDESKFPSERERTISRWRFYKKDLKKWKILKVYKPEMFLNKNTEKLTLEEEQFYAVAFQSPDESKIVIAYRGTDGNNVADDSDLTISSRLGLDKDLIDFDWDFALEHAVTNRQIGVSSPGRQFELAGEFYRRIVENQKHKGKTISITGHSLGGGLAQYASVIAAGESDSEDEVKETVTWNGIGIKHFSKIIGYEFLDTNGLSFLQRLKNKFAKEKVEEECENLTNNIMNHLEEMGLMKNGEPTELFLNDEDKIDLEKLEFAIRDIIMPLERIDGDSNLLDTLTSIYKYNNDDDNNKSLLESIYGCRCLSSKLSHLIKNLFEYSHSNITIKSSAG
jgi:hypothetical protein